MVRECPLDVNDWDQHFINFAVFLTSVDWLVIVLFFFYAGYIMCSVDNSVGS